MKKGVAHLKTFTGERCNEFAQKKSWFLGEFSKDQEVIQQGSAGYKTRIRELYNKDQEVIYQG